MLNYRKLTGLAQHECGGKMCRAAREGKLGEPVMDYTRRARRLLLAGMGGLALPLALAGLAGAQEYAQEPLPISAPAAPTAPAAPQVRVVSLADAVSIALSQ